MVSAVRREGSSTAARQPPGAPTPERYQLGELLGSGGMAEVFRSRDQVLDRDVAVKLARDTVGSRDRERFKGEARVLARLSHPAIVTVLDAGISADRPFLVLELIEGRTLADVLQEGPLDLDGARTLGVELAEALAYAHAAGVVHRDVKPGNVLLGEAGLVKLADFGIARLLGDTVRHTETGAAVGTAAYLAPEQVQGNEVTAGTDVYSLGLVLLEGLTGQRAFPGSPTESALARLHREPEVPPSLPPSWQDLLRAMVQRDPALRPGAATVAAQLRAVQTAPPTQRLDGEATGTRVLPTVEAAAPEVAPEVPPGAAPQPSALDRAGDALAHHAKAGWGRLRALPEYQRGLVAVFALLAILLLAAAVFSSSGERARPTDPPRGTPPGLVGPLGDLHRTVYGDDG